eukprot:CAMPEP_0185615952 /NCGR_PEP_ID=MMETSP0436-20130131/37829_1 /TAXON_ID=626734 ORGANISM="Favella taraikaensis, Strain Fe Narragansett Bay" /NCGR_SAMPLE_ID=MMETSP0436 /ASSEMBLY_ACC=CAM_ASM_000390 /LENGTH=54 /DNA_ID=CAMNT_0028252217 /DNA_START=52 /DNA_END=213 /DNA_ORIENTATION=+
MQSQFDDEVKIDEASAQAAPHIVILWDLLKKRLRPSELAEMARLIGTEMIDTIE